MSVRVTTTHSAGHVGRPSSDFSPTTMAQYKMYQHLTLLISKNKEHTYVVSFPRPHHITSDWRFF